MTSTSLQPRIFLISHARTQCHLLEKMLGAQPNTQYAQHFTMGINHKIVEMLAQGPIDQVTTTMTDDLKAFWQKSWQDLQTFLTEVDNKQGRAFYHDHAHFNTNPIVLSDYIYNLQSSIPRDLWTVKSDNEIGSTNPTVLPDSFLLDPRHKYIFTIRHPLLMIPSNYRANVTFMKRDEHGRSPAELKSTEIFCTSLHWSRLLYDWLTNHNMQCLIIDADDYLETSDDGSLVPSSVLRTLCEGVGFDPGAIQMSWPSVTEEELDGMYRGKKVMFQDILHSTGPMSGKQKGRKLVLEHERMRWKEEFGESGARMVEEMIDITMEDYEYMWERRVR